MSGSWRNKGAKLHAPKRGAGTILADIFGLIPLILVLTLVLAFFMKELPLRKTTAARKAVPEDLE
jgi:hypothetical protein